MPHSMTEEARGRCTRRRAGGVQGGAGVESGRQPGRAPHPFAQLVVRESLAAWRGFPLFSGGPTADGGREGESPIHRPTSWLGRAGELAGWSARDPALPAGPQR